ncbi:MAG: Lrp/AsnC family transcriptional regulator [Nitrosopumilaceae archaeon]|nr:Lrp/AsnC family transcriptional regulator [Nitrosopumilaceae archaeon]
MRLLYELAADSSVSIPTLASSMDVSTSVLYSRIKRLVKKRLIKKYTIIIDDSLLGIGVRAAVGIKRDPKFKESIHDRLMEAQEVESISEVTGRFDIMIRVHARNLEELHSIVIEKIGKIVGIQSTETLVELQKTEKDPAYLIERRQ